jgi:hypothetical protein
VRAVLSFKHRVEKQPKGMVRSWSLPVGVFYGFRINDHMYRASTPLGLIQQAHHGAFVTPKDSFKAHCSDMRHEMSKPSVLAGSKTHERQRILEIEKEQPIEKMSRELIGDFDWRYDVRLDVVCLPTCVGVRVEPNPGSPTPLWA